MPQRLTTGQTIAQLKKRYERHVLESRVRNINWERLMAVFDALERQREMEREMQRQSCQASLPTTIIIIKVYPNAF